MIDNIYFTTNDIDEEIQDTEKEFSQLLSQLEAPDNISILEGEWDIYILLFALLGKLEILSNITNKQIVIKDKIKEFKSYLIDFNQKIVTRIEKYIKPQIMQEYSKFIEYKEMLLEIYEFEDFLNHRDTIKLFLLQCNKYFSCTEIATQVEDNDRIIKPYIIQKIIPALVLEYGEEILDDFIVDNLPESFWWRKKEDLMHDIMQEK